MKKLVLAILLIASPAWAQTQLLPKSATARIDKSATARVDKSATARVDKSATARVDKSATARVDNCAPIGRTEDGKLVYSMKCETLPAPPSPPPQAEAAPAPPPEPEIHRSGTFGMSFERKRPDE